MHLEGILRRQGSKIKVKHIAEILNSPLTPEGGIKSDYKIPPSGSRGLLL
jgi:hypothetical protein